MKILKFEELNESKKLKSEINTDETFKKFVYDRLKLKFQENFDEERAEEVVSGLLTFVGGTDGNRNYSKIIGIANH